MSTITCRVAESGRFASRWTLGKEWKAWPPGYEREELQRDFLKYTGSQ